MAQDIFLHAGAHRTGTSSFQLMLARNRPALRAAGVLPLYPGRDGAPGGRLRLRLPGPGTGPRKRAALADMLRDALSRDLGGADAPPQVLVSEENIPGRMLHFYSGQFFPAAPRRLAMLAAALEAQGIARPARVVYVIRPYAALFESAYRKRAEDNPVAPFAEIAPAMVAMQAGWPDVVAQIRDVLAPETLVVLSYPGRGRSVDLLAQVLGRRIDGLVEPEARVNLSATDAALEALQARYHAGETLDRAAWQAVVAEHAEDRAPRGVAAFTAAQRATLDARYAAHLDRLAAMPGVTFLG
jgi:hypothetical protein